MTRTVLLALAGFSLFAVVQPAIADTAQRNPVAFKPVIQRMGEILTTRMDAKLAEEQAAATAAAAAESDTKLTQK